MALETHQRLANCWLFCDLDGTLIGHRETLSAANREALQKLRAAGMRIVPATGRNWKTLHEALSPDAPADFAIFSTGAGVVDWQRPQTVHGTLLPADSVRKGRALLDLAQVDYALHYGWPDNHFFAYRAVTPEANCPSDFYGRIRHNADGHVISADFCPDNATQFLVILGQGEKKRAAEIASLFGKEFSAVRATSPADGKSIWLEIFAANVNKAHAATWLTAQYGAGETYAIGNDHNDLALLEWADHALVMPDAPAELKARFPVVDSDSAHLMENVQKMPGWEFFAAK